MSMTKISEHDRKNDNDERYLSNMTKNIINITTTTISIWLGDAPTPSFGPSKEGIAGRGMD